MFEDKFLQGMFKEFLILHVLADESAEETIGETEDFHVNGEIFEVAFLEIGFLAFSRESGGVVF